MDLNLEEKDIIQLVILLGYATLILFLYVCIWLLLRKTIKKKIVKAFLIGLITPLFFYYFIICMFKPIAVLLYITGIDPIGIVVAVLTLTYKQLSIVAGMVATIYLIKNN